MDEQPHANGAGVEHTESFPARPCPRTPFEKALLGLLLLQARDGRDGLRDGRRAAMIHALDNRATWIQIRHWRRGTGRVPQWAKELLASKIAARRQADEQNESAAIAA